MRSTCRFTAIALFFVIILMLFGCSNDNESVKHTMTPTTLSALYPGDIQKVDSIEIRSGSTGELKAYTDHTQVQEAINKLSELTLVPDPNQEGRTGFLYSISFFEGKELKLGITNNSIAGVYYNHNEDLVQEMQALFENKQ